MDAMPTGTKQINANLYVGPTFKVWRAHEEWKYRTFGRCRVSVEGRTTRLDLALADVRRYA